ncbi:uncharacterized protein LOC127115287 [Lathyrus oleraceus]|uniref:uncharacterized protein LOC127115287 n=1 Tax=Pisum sativum TaxID=3888 RepID=UPI0021D194E0|nr:uncharacterized protein LOC127115287 [Pisum sativum]
MQKIFTHLINRLNSLGKPISNNIATNKVLRSLNREWKPKVVAIKEANDLKVLDFTTLFDKLEEHKQELICLEKHEKREESSQALLKEFKSSKDDENRKGKFRSSCYSYGEVGHYRPECPMIKKDKKKGHAKKFRRTYVAYENASDYSIDESSTSSVEFARICLMENGRKKKNVSPSKLKLTSDLSYFKLQDTFDNLHREALNAFKKLASHENIFLQLEVKVLESEKKLEVINLSMLDVQKDKIEDEKTSRFGCESCHYWQEEINVLQVKLDNALQPKISFSIYPSTFGRSLNHSHKKHKNFKKGSNGKSTSHHNLSYHYCCQKGHTIEKCKFRKVFVPKGVSQWLPKCNLDFTHSQGHNEIWDNLGKFDSKSDEGIFLGYSQSSKAYRAYKKGVSSQDILKEPDDGIDQAKTMENERVEDDNCEEEKVESPTAVDDIPFTWKQFKDHPIDNILGDITKGMTKRSKIIFEKLQNYDIQYLVCKISFSDLEHCSTI